MVVRPSRARARRTMRENAARHQSLHRIPSSRPIQALLWAPLLAPERRQATFCVRDLLFVGARASPAFESTTPPHREVRQPAGDRHRARVAGRNPAASARIGALTSHDEHPVVRVRDAAAGSVDRQLHRRVERPRAPALMSSEHCRRMRIPGTAINTVAKPLERARRGG